MRRSGAAMTRVWLTGGLVVVLLQLLAPGTSSAAGADDGCRSRGRAAEAPVTGAVFNDPTGKVADQFRILSTVVDDINGTPPGEDIRIATLSIAAKSVVTALTAAHDCGVHVRVLVPGRAWQQPDVVRLREVLGTDVSRNSYLTRCEGSCTSDGDDGIMHAKSYLFSRVRGTGPVTIYSSSNLTRSQATKRWNDAYQLAGAKRVYASATAFFDTLVRDEPADFPRVTKAAGYWQYNFPAGHDFHLGILDKTSCDTGSGSTAIEFVASIWKQVAVAKKLAELQDAGCDVHVALSLGKAEQGVLETLLDRGVPTRVQAAGDPGGATHSKYIAIKGMHDGYVVQTVYSGSLNVSNFSGQTANNNMIRIVDDAPTYAAYDREFGRLWNDSRTLRRADVDAADAVDARAAEAQD